MQKVDMRNALKIKDFVLIKPWQLYPDRASMISSTEYHTKTLLDHWRGFAMLLNNRLRKMATDWIPVIQQAFQGPKSTVLKPLGWLLAIMISGSVAGSKCGSPAWLVAAFGIAACISFVVYVWAYIYFGRKNPELLRSEGHLFRMKALEQGWVGDNSSGWRQLTDTTPALEIENSRPPEMPQDRE